MTGSVIDGRSNRYFGALRYLPDGSLDPAFGSNGLVAADLGSFEEPRAVALQRDGKIVVAGETDCETARCFAAMRLNPDGSPDAGFGAGGVVRVPFYLHAAWANDVAIDGAGRIVMAGVRLRGGDAQDSATICVIRLLGDGRPDPAFSGDGVALVDHGYGNDSAEAVLLRGGKVIVAGRGPRRVGEQPLRGRAPARRRPARPLLRPPRAPAGVLRRAPARHGLRARGGAARPDRRGRQRGGRGPRSRRWRSPGWPAAAAVERRVRTSPGPFGGYAKAVRVTRAGILVAGRAYTRAGHRPVRLGARPPRARPAGSCGVDARPTSAPARTRPRRSRSRRAARPSPARSTAATASPATSRANHRGQTPRRN